jgi:hypothetical protein
MKYDHNPEEVPFAAFLFMIGVMLAISPFL